MSNPFVLHKGGHAVSYEPESVEVPELSDEEKENLQKRMEAMDKLLATQKKAKYKLELFFGDERSMQKPVPGILSFWESGSQLHGGGDAKVYLCPGKLKKKNECEAVIPFAFNAYGHLVCPACQTTWKGEEVIGEVMGRHDMRQWSQLLYRYFLRFNGNCDIYLKHAPTDIRSMARTEQEKSKGGELLLKARKRALHIYPLRNIIKDTSAGADVLGRLYSFLVS